MPALKPARQRFPVVQALQPCNAASTAPDEARRTLACLHTPRDQLVDTSQQQGTRLHGAETTERDSLERHFAWLDAEIAMIEKACLDHIRAHEELQE